MARGSSLNRKEKHKKTWNFKKERTLEVAKNKGNYNGVSI